MALRTASIRLAAVSIRAQRPILTTFTRQYASQAAEAFSNPANAASAPSNTRNAVPNPDPSPESTTSQLVNDQQAYMVATYVRPQLMFQRGQGVYLWDTENRKYLDFTAGIAVNSLGHCDEDIAAIIHDQSRTLMHTSNLYHNPWTGALSKALVDATKQTGGMHDASRAFICNSGTEANEAAIKFARKVGKELDPSEQKVEIVSFRGAFHGRTLGALSATPTEKYQKPFAPLMPGFRYGDLNDEAAIEKLVTAKTAGVIVEPIQGEGGVNAASEEFLIALAKRCREVGAVLIYDEIQCGLGRTGQFWAHSVLPKVAHPDIITTAKALGNGYPVAATLVNDFVADKIKTGDHGTTFGGNPLGSRIACHIISRLSDKKLLNAVSIKESLFREHFARLRKRWPDAVKEIRGRGLILGLQMTSDPAPVVAAARERGLLVITCGTNTLRFVPSLTITEGEIEKGAKMLEDALESVLGEGVKA